MRKERKHYTAEEKVAVLRRHLLDKVPVSDLCEELGLQPTVFYRWQKEFFENGAATSKHRNVLAASSPARRAWSIPQRMSSNSPVLCASVEIEISTPAAAACRAVSSTSLAKARILLGLNGHPGGWLARLLIPTISSKELDYTVCPSNLKSTSHN